MDYRRTRYAVFIPAPDSGGVNVPLPDVKRKNREPSETGSTFPSGVPVATSVFLTVTQIRPAFTSGITSFATRRVDAAEEQRNAKRRETVNQSFRCFSSSVPFFPRSFIEPAVPESVLADGPLEMKLQLRLLNRVTQMPARRCSRMACHSRVTERQAPSGKNIPT